MPAFRALWAASLLSNLGLLVQNVAAAWAMTEMTTGPQMVALVQTATMLPLLMLSLFAGAAADTFDRRLVMLLALAIGLVGATTLSVLAFLDMLTPWLLLAFSFAIGSSMAIHSPAWQASVGELVPPRALPAGVALNSISFNVARTIGPALGGFIVAVVGVVAAFVATALFYIPFVVALLRWKRDQEPARFPPEGVARAVVSGVLYVLHSSPITVVLARTFLIALFGSAIPALTPLVTRDQLHADASLYGVLLGCYGAGAVLGAVTMARLRAHLSVQTLAAISTMMMGVSAAVVGLSHSPLLTALALAPAGAGWMLSMTLFNVAVQLSAPRWVTARALGTFQMSVAAGVALGSWWWGEMAAVVGIAGSMFACALGLVVACPLLGLCLKIRALDPQHENAGAALSDPQVGLGITDRSGPVVIEVEYVVPQARARDFYRIMQQVRKSRRRYGAYAWSIARNIADPTLWTERYQYPTWLDYLRQRSRTTQDERDLQSAALSFHDDASPVRVRRMLERPFGSVRWEEDAPDAPNTNVLPHTPT